MKRKNNRQHKPVQQDPLQQEVADILSQSPTPAPTPVPTPTPEPTPAPLEVLVTEAHYPAPQPEPVSEPAPEAVPEPEPAPEPAPEAVPEPEPVSEPAPEAVPEPEPVPVQVMALIQDLQKQILDLNSQLKEAKGKVAALEAIFGGTPDVFMTKVFEALIQEAKQGLEKKEASLANMVVEKIRKYHKNPYAVNNPDF